MRRAPLVSAVLVTLAWGSGPRVQAAQVRDNGAVSATPRGTAVVSGVVVIDDASNRPLRRVSVTLASGNLQVPQTTVTDEEGVFTFAALPAGNYTLVATRPGYVTSFYGAKKPGRGPGVPIAVLDGQRVTDVRVRVLKGAVITGLVRYEDGSPAQGVDVQVLSLRTVDGQRRATQTFENVANLQGVTTDERGRYRAFGLAPGDYVVQSIVRANPLANFSAPGRLVTPAEIQWAQQASTGSLTTAPGQPASPLSPAPPLGQTVDYSAVYYPGTVTVSDAGVIALGAGEERDGVDFATRLVPTAKVKGAVTDADGRPSAGAQISLRPIDSDSTDIVGAILGGGGSRTAADGTFVVNGVRPGRYRLMARGGARTAAPSAAPAVSGPPAAGAPPPPPPPPPPGMNLDFGGMFGASAGQTSWALQEITVEGRDISDVVLQLRPGMTISGTIAFESTSLTPPTDLSRARVTLSSAPTGNSVMEMATAMLGSSMGTTSATGAFAINGVIPGSYRMNIILPGMRLNSAARGTGWMLKSISVNGRDVADLALEVKPNESLAGLVVTMTDTPAELSGTVLDRAGRPAPGFPIIVFSTDRAYWTVGSRRVQQIRPSSDGKFFIAGLPAGEYFVCAVTDLDQSDLYDRTFLDQLAASAFKITLAEGEKKTQDLRLAGGG